MLAYFDREQQALALQMGRYHPWTVTAGTVGGRYVDFKNAPPELIRSTLEDLPHVAGTAAEAAVVDFLLWANGPHSIFETNDFGLRPLRTNESGVSSKALELMCRVTVLFRDPSRNTLSGDLSRFAGTMEHEIKLLDANFDQACWGWCLWPHLFTALGHDNPSAEGHVIQYQLWAWGDDPLEVYSHFSRAFSNLRGALENSIARMTPNTNA